MSEKHHALVGARLYKQYRTRYTLLVVLASIAVLGMAYSLFIAQYVWTAVATVVFAVSVGLMPVIFKMYDKQVQALLLEQLDWEAYQSYFHTAYDQAHPTKKSRVLQDRRLADAQSAYCRGWFEEARDILLQIDKTAYPAAQQTSLQSLVAYHLSIVNDYLGRHEEAQAARLELQQLVRDKQASRWAELLLRAEAIACVIEKKPTEYFDEAAATDLFGQVANAYYAAHNALLHQDLHTALACFEWVVEAETLAPDLFYVQVAKLYLANQTIESSVNTEKDDL